MNGDDQLSAIDRKYWAIHHELIVSFECYTLFKYERWNCRTGRRGFLRWYVPRDHPQCFQIMQWLDHELDCERTTDWDMDDVVIPGMDVWVEVMEFSGVDYYIDRDTSELLAAQMLNRLKSELRYRKEDS